MVILPSGLPILQHVRHDEREDFLYAFVEMAQHERNIVAANNAYLAEEVAPKKVFDTYAS